MSGPKTGRTIGGSEPIIVARMIRISGKAVLLSRYFSLRP